MDKSVKNQWLFPLSNFQPLKFQAMTLMRSRARCKNWWQIWKLLSMSRSLTFKAPLMSWKKNYLSQVLTRIHSNFTFNSPNLKHKSPLTWHLITNLWLLRTTASRMSRSSLTIKKRESTLINLVVHSWMTTRSKSSRRNSRTIINILYWRYRILIIPKRKKKMI